MLLNKSNTAALWRSYHGLRVVQVLGLIVDSSCTLWPLFLGREDLGFYVSCGS
ncbi:hypothetical protein HanHA89_Chr05g0198981 [Helianthus annuus]|nr:hypothetical protein HanHA89_Chr05g0198981 [Helianthus annuus]